MFGRKKKELPPGVSVMHYDGLPGISQDSPCFMEQTTDALVFRKMEGATITLPLEKISTVDIMDERNFGVRYRGTGELTSKTNAVKWYAVINYDAGKRIILWFLGGKESKALWGLKKQIESQAQDITL